MGDIRSKTFNYSGESAICNYWKILIWQIKYNGIKKEYSWETWNQELVYNRCVKYKAYSNHVVKFGRLCSTIINIGILCESEGDVLADENP